MKKKLIPKGQTGIKSLLNRANDSTIGNVIKIIDPTGITNYYDAGRSIKHFLNKPSAGSFGEAMLDTIGALPLIGKLGKIYKLSKTPVFVKMYKKFSPISNSIGKGVAYIANEVFDGVSKGVIRKSVRNNLKDIPVLFSRLTNSGTTIDYNINQGDISKSLLYNLASNTSGNASFVAPFIGLDNSARKSIGFNSDDNSYNGSYIFGAKPKQTYSGSAKGDIDILSQFIQGRGVDTTYNYPIIPLDTIFINKADKDNLNDKIFLNLDFANIKNLKDRDKYKKTLIDAKTVTGEVNNNILHLHDIWDMAGSTGIFGDRFEHILNKDGKYHAVKYKQDIPIAISNDTSKINYTNNLLKSIYLDKQLFKVKHQFGGLLSKYQNPKTVL